MITFKAKTPSGEIIKSAISEFNFPAGEAFIKVEPQRSLEKTEIAVLQPSADSLHDDLFKLAMWSNYLLSKSGVSRVLVVPYFPGARADRVSPGVEEPFGLEVYAEFISSMLLDQIVIFDPHSGGVVTELKNADLGARITVVESDELWKQPHLLNTLLRYTGIIAPDKGAVQRAGRVASLLGIPLHTAEKTRDPQTGKLSGFKLDGLDKYGKYLIVDDICDGGGTFCGLAEATGLGKECLDLYVSHGVFSGNAHFKLSKHFEHIYTTNSYFAESSNPNQFFEKGSTRIRRAAPIHHLDVIHLMLDKVV
jgi:ribose-phosphate pyrophosphokinase